MKMKMHRVPCQQASPLWSTADNSHSDRTNMNGCHCVHISTQSLSQQPTAQPTAIMNGSVAADILHIHSCTRPP